MQVLLLSHKRKDVRDTAKYPPLMKPQVRSNRTTSVLHHNCTHMLAADCSVCLHHRCMLVQPAALQARTGKLKPRALRHLASEVLGLTIQEGEHSPVDDARAALYIYLKHRKVRQPRRGCSPQAGLAVYKSGARLAALVVMNLLALPALLPLSYRSGSVG